MDPTPQDILNAWRGLADPPGACGVSARTWRRWISGEARIPRAVVELGRVRQGELAAVADAWRGWRIRGGVLIDPSSIEHTPRTITAWHWAAQELAAVRQGENLRARGVEILTARIGHAITQELYKRLNP